MKPFSLTLVGLRILAIYLVSQSFLEMASSVPQFIRMPQAYSHLPLGVVIVSWMLAPLVIGVLLWLAAPQLAHWATRRIRGDVLETMQLPALASAAYVVAGVVLVATGLPNVVLEILRIWIAHMPPSSPYAGYVAFLVANLVRCLLGAALILGRPGLRRVLYAVRYRGSSAAPGETDAS